MRYGFFDLATREYVIVHPDTPKPWSNYIGSRDFGGVVTNHAAGYTFYRSAAQGRLTRFLFNAPPAHWPGRYLYVRDNEVVWCPSWLPVKQPLDTFRYECRHGLGYTRIVGERDGLVVGVTFFVPPGRLYEVWDVELSVRSGPPREVGLFAYVEPQCNWNADDDARNLQYTQYIAQTRCVANGLIDIGSNVNMPEDPEHFTNKDQQRHTFFALVGARAVRFDGDREVFLGPYGSYAHPQAVMRGSCGNSTAYGDMPCAAFEIPCRVEPGGPLRLALVFGVGCAEVEGERARREMVRPESRRAAIEEIRRFWAERLQTLTLETGAPDLDAMGNTWAPYNNLMTFYWSRTASLVYTGERDGYGYRDTVQDLVGTSSLIPDETRSRLELMLTGQFSNGGCKPVVQPFDHHPGAEPPPSIWRSDDGLWLFNAVTAYVRETGHLDFFRRVLPFADRGETDVVGHLRKALDFNLERRGAHGLPCGLHADWNDCLRLGERGESVFVAFQLRYGLREYREIVTRLGDPDEAMWAERQLAELDEAIERYAWDGEWYLRAYREDGFKFGSRESDEGRIFLNPQSWAILSGHATGIRARALLEVVERELGTPYGFMLCAPPYVRTDHRICLARLMNPGCKENAGIFYHTQGWAVLAAAMVGDGDRAWAWLRRVLPSSFNERAEIREIEPYVVCQSAHSPYSPYPGRGRVSWLSGSAVWNYVALAQGLLGIQPEYDGLRLRPCISSDVRTLRYRRIFRGARYEVEIVNPDGRSGWARLVELEGTRLREDGLLLPAEPGRVVRVRMKL